jgi:hypothetical protein
MRGEVNPGGHFAALTSGFPYRKQSSAFGTIRYPDIEQFAAARTVDWLPLHEGDDDQPQWTQKCTQKITS